MLVNVIRAVSIGLLACAACASAPAQARLTQAAPDFTLVDTEGRAVSLRALVAHGPVILAFFPAAFTYG